MYNLYSFKIKELLFGPIRSTSVHFGLLQSTVVPFGPLRFTSVHCGPIQSNLVHWGNFFSPDALFRPRAYKNRASGQKKIFPSGSRVLESRDPLGNFFFPRCSVFLSSRPKQSIWGKKISPVDLESLRLEFYWEIFFFFTPGHAKLLNMWTKNWEILDIQNCWIGKPETGKLLEM